MTNPKPKLSHTERAERRKAIAQRVRETQDPYAIVREFSVSFHTVRKACEMHNVPCYTKSPKFRPGAFRVLAELLNTSDSARVIANRLSVSDQHVYETLRAAREVGIRFLHRDKEKGK